MSGESVERGEDLSSLKGFVDHPSWDFMLERIERQERRAETARRFREAREMIWGYAATIRPGQSEQARALRAWWRGVEAADNAENYDKTMREERE